MAGLLGAPLGAPQDSACLASPTAPESSPVEVGVSSLPAGPSQPPTSCAVVGSFQLGFSTDPFPPLQRDATLPALGPDATFLERLSPVAATRASPAAISGVNPAVALTEIAAKAGSVNNSSKSNPESLLVKTPPPKVVRFAPEFLSAETPSCASRSRKMAPYSDICHPIKVRRSNLGNLASEGVPVDDGPKLASSPSAEAREALEVVPIDHDLSSIDIRSNPGAVIENHDLLIPPSDGMTSKMELASIIDPDLTPSPISRFSEKILPVCFKLWGAGFFMFHWLL
ncbi:hypothetical protein Nepgr_031291 [Nepenthes gracilis]|uniref:Uncharacterized protein n=1 Tax=Nepenthes gracilis TaxID=150966 RepID=A0AAD3TG96_NEPGR|nr:hypothetical protein Nepgr_031291 [Nepenthes gracilis]